MLHTAIVEDDDSYANQLQTFLSRYASEKNCEISVTRFKDGLDFVEGYRPVWDIILMDIEMPKMDGMMAAHEIREIDKECIIIFITNMAKYAIRGYEVDALDYVLKPISYFPFSLKLDKAVTKIKRSETKSLLVPTENGVQKLQIKDILYIEVMFHRLQIHTISEVITMPGSLSEMEKKLEGEHFAKCNKGYLVNLRHISLVKKDSVIVGEEELIVSRRRHKEFLEAVTVFFGGVGR